MIETYSNMEDGFSGLCGKRMNDSIIWRWMFQAYNQNIHWNEICIFRLKTEQRNSINLE